MTVPTRNALLRIVLTALLLTSLTGCDFVKAKLGFEDSATKAANAEADGKAVGGACRQSGRAIEDCYSIYAWLPRAAIFQGWREMDGYMRENQIDTIEPQLPPSQPPPPPPPPKKKATKATKKTDAAAEDAESTNSEKK